MEEKRALPTVCCRQKQSLRYGMPGTDTGHTHTFTYPDGTGAGKADTGHAHTRTLARFGVV
eukprot:1209204-Rhodomonas_salina.1